MSSLKMFEDFCVGQRVLYTGVTSYTDDKTKVVKAKGTIIAVGNSVSISLDKYRLPYYVPDGDKNKSMRGVYIIPKKHYANVSVADLILGIKKIEVFRE